MRIPLTQGLFAEVDEQDYAELAKYTWVVMRGPNYIMAVRNYTKESGKHGAMLMHKQIMRPREGQQISHLDGNKLNNTRSNLALDVKHSQIKGLSRCSISGDTATIMLADDCVCLIDTVDLDVVGKYTWNRTKPRTGYAMRVCSTHKTSVLMHRQLAVHHGIILPGSPLHIDHVNGDKLDNRKNNLRAVTRKQNCRNQHVKKQGRSGPYTSRFRGVSKNRHGKWKSEITLTGVYRYLGSFPTEFLAAGAYDTAGIAEDPEHFNPNFSASWLAPQHGKAL